MIQGTARSRTELPGLKSLRCGLSGPRIPVNNCVTYRLRWIAEIHEEPSNAPRRQIEKLRFADLGVLARSGRAAHEYH